MWLWHHKVASTQSTLAKKFNVVLFGIAEYPKETKKLTLKPVTKETFNYARVVLGSTCREFV